MTMFFVTLLFIILFTLLMYIGVLLNRKPLEGSCGGLGKIMGEDCAFCDKKEKCKKAVKSACDVITT